MWRILLVAVMLVFAGCGAGGPSQTTASPTAGAQSSTPTTTPTATPTETVTPTATPSPTPQPANNPWREEVVTVSISREAQTAYSEYSMVREALTFWTEADSGYDLRFVITDDPDADINVRFVSDIPVCDGEADDDTIGCADLLPRGGTFSDQTHVSIKAGYNRTSTVAVLKHELGHVLGYEHSDDDTFGFMNATIAATPVGLPNATERANPWQNETLRVYVDDLPANYYDSGITEQLEQTFGYYENGAGGTVPANITFTRVESRENADITILFDVEMSAGSDAKIYGYNTDSDSALETYSRATIRLEDIDQDSVGWHIGYWLAYLFAVPADSYPEPFDDPESDPRENWWQHYD